MSLVTFDVTCAGCRPHEGTDVAAGVNVVVVIGGGALGAPGAPRSLLPAQLAAHNTDAPHNITDTNLVRDSSFMKSLPRDSALRARSNRSLTMARCDAIHHGVWRGRARVPSGVHPKTVTAPLFTVTVNVGATLAALLDAGCDEPTGKLLRLTIR